MGSFTIVFVHGVKVHSYLGPIQATPKLGMCNTLSINFVTSLHESLL